ncbi:MULTISPECIES: 3,4-dihydroxy-2-butanone-4-phosphate synthase [Thalassospira]|uniref:3,4-dihydroxy-2-butanone 4-phosphate synthase n=2 Tax=Thalassospira TaxID=168934 RepID=A0AB72UCY6_9PROT|nr:MULTISPECIES: 3,4-dihydroxy-2-butanone-4-phosphate synthase [Thalassospira]AJD52116.1 riboflavin biosynthesis protein ribA [Thalassospira xiamenensis M-5 = DSM 17429]KEO50710.1 3,4-dihydroxy-2-butanone 4-phosphate synthase [Thalassospira permensis NBRC 106175]RCK42859.1 3,4-dihydroxy-2-butanone 4-phosphate synthase [Thalassospira xiamenensis]SIS91206.1 3,4-dihydroxy 2-butanone 4-phosphate synthase / GTP cyclohydrolase II [Thalassospira xiamenensis M-5 = DSM 17429]
MPHRYLSPIEDVIEEARNGRMFILVDDEDRENEGDLVIPAQMATPDAINFMATYGRGLICLTLESERCDHLGLPLMSARNGTRHETAFTVSIEAATGVTTGISAPDRARTISVAIDTKSTSDDIVTPGHVFPLRARPGGVLVRAGHTEASVDISRLAGLNPSGVICEIMSESGEMARLPELVEFAKKHNLKIAQIADLIRYRRKHERVVQRKATTKINSVHGGEFELNLYVNNVTYAEHIALVKGDISDAKPVLTRVHALNVLEDVLGDRQGAHGGELQAAMRQIGEEGRGVIVLIREPRPNTLSSSIAKLIELNGGDGDALRQEIAKSADDSDLRDYGVGAQILLDLGVRDMILLSNTKRHIVGLDGFGLNLVDQRPLVVSEE